MQLKGRALNTVWIITIKAKWGNVKVIAILRLLLRELGSLAPQLTKHSRRLFLIKTLSKTLNS